MTYSPSEEFDPLHQKIIELVPELGSAMHCSRCGREYGDPMPCRVRLAVYRSHKPVRVKINRPITLADVLRAIGVKQSEPSSGFGLSVNAYGGIYMTHSPKWEEEYAGEWDLSTDLDGQSEELKAFLSKVLGV